MSAVVWILLGLIAGVVFLGLGLYLYFILGTIKTLTDSLKSLIATLQPVFSSEDVLRGFKAFQLLSEQGEQIGRKMESLDKTIQMFYQFAFKASIPGVTPSTQAESIVSGYNEEDFVAHESADRARKNKESNVDSRVSVAPSEVPPPDAMF